ncbi:hypothetical protein [Janthinobacterium sp. 75]|uniref:hypothetical protein n=1 Tax=Janthinobacterium sp. 75 TaxID=2135628 RepID=UPI0010628766|nr:hypothetical protein [Janthinobacterium sp. 75]TDY34757.1 hypothetical protein C8C89_2582 [Janthinobacterium sp. 75]
MADYMRRINLRLNEKYHVFVGPLLLLALLTAERPPVCGVFAGLLCALTLNKGIDILRKL